MSRTARQAKNTPANRVGTGDQPPRRRSGTLRFVDFANWSVRTKLVAILVLPVVATVAVGAVRVSDLLQTADDYADDARTSAAQRTTGELVRELGREQLVVVAEVSAATAADAAGDVSEPLAGLPQRQAQEAATDAAAAQLRVLLGEVDDQSLEVVRSYRGLENALDRLVDVRANTDTVEGSVLTSAQVVRAYDDIAGTALRIGDALSGNVQDDRIQALSTSSQSLVARNRLARKEDAFVLGIAALGPEVVDPAELRNVVTDRADAFGRFQQTASARQQSSYSQAFSTESGQLRTELFAEVLRTLSAGGTPSVSPEQWAAVVVPAADDIDAVQQGISNDQVAVAEELRDETRVGVLRESAVVILLLLLGFAFTLYAVRSVLRPLRILQSEAMAIAQQRLPTEIARIREGLADVDAAVTPVGVSTSEEIGQVARAFDAVHQEALRLAGEQEELRRNVNDIFVNLSRRSQGLVERQLALIDRLENEEQDPDQLSQLFRLDHLASRMRRNNDNLMVLAGAEGSRGTTGSMAVVDVVRASVSETDQYERVVVNPTPAVTVAQGASNDLVHLLAELLDNATVFSPPESTVTVAVSGSYHEGLVIEVYDRGLGVSPVDMQSLNRKLAEPPVVDAQVPRQMGLFVVSRLADRHGMQVELRESASGTGTVAAVWVPSSALDMSEIEAASNQPPVALLKPLRGQLDGDTDTLPVATLARPMDDQPFQPDRAREPAAAELVTASPALRIPYPDEPAVNGSAAHRESHTAPIFTPGLAPVVDVPRVDVPRVDVPRVDVPRVEVPRHDPLGPLPYESEATPIFAELSAWFASPGPVAPAVDAPAASGVPEVARNGHQSTSIAASDPVRSFDSVADEGWRLVEAVMSVEDADVTAAGLPRRRPKAHLIPGSAAPDITAAPTRRRNADAVRGRLTNYQRGLQSGRVRTKAVDDAEPNAEPDPTAERIDTERRYAR